MRSGGGGGGTYVSFLFRFRLYYCAEFHLFRIDSGWLIDLGKYIWISSFRVVDGDDVRFFFFHFCFISELCMEPVALLDSLQVHATPPSAQSANM